MLRTALLALPALLLLASGNARADASPASPSGAPSSSPTASAGSEVASNGAPTLSSGEPAPVPATGDPALSSVDPAPAAASGTSTPAEATPAALRRPAFAPGEEATYEVGALGMTAGKARVTVGALTDRDGVSAWPIVVLARTDSVFDAVFPVKDKFVTWWHPDSGRVIGADLIADEGGKRHRSRSVLDHDAGKAEVRREKDDGSRSVSSYDIPPGTYDIAGAVMALRNRPLEVGSIEEVTVFTGRKTFRLRCIIERRERVRVGAGEFDAKVATVQLGFDGSFASKRDVRAWFSDDGRHVPLKVEAEFALGTIAAELVRFHRGLSR